MDTGEVTKREEIFAPVEKSLSIRRSQKLVGKLVRQEERTFYLFVAPWLLGFLCFIFGPIVASLYFSFTEWNVFSSPKWIGISNYRVLLTATPLFWISLRVTTVAALANIGLGTVISLAMAVLLNQRVRGTSIYRTIFFYLSQSAALLPSWFGSGFTSPTSD